VFSVGAWRCIAIGLGLCAAALNVAPGFAASGIERRAFALGDWHLNIGKDRFSGDVRCRLRARNGRSLYVADAVGVRFGRRADVMGATLKIDGGQPVRYRDLLPELARLRVAIDGRDMDRPTGGVVWIPSSLLESAKRVAISPRPGAHPRYFSLRGFVALRESARALGCAPEGRFVR